MKMRKEIVAAALIGGTMLFAPAAKAAVVYSYVTDASNYSVPQSGSQQTVTVTVFLKETLTGGSTSLIDKDGGLFGGAFSVTRASSGLPTVPAVFSGTTGDIAGDSANFPGGSFSAGINSATEVGGGDTVASSGISNGPETANSTLTGTIELGTVTIEVPANASAGATSFTLGNYKYPTVPANVNSSAAGFTETYGSDSLDLDLDVTNDNGGVAATYAGASGAPGAEAFTVTVAPEPASLGLGALGVLGLLARRRNRRGAAIA